MARERAHASTAPSRWSLRLVVVAGLAADAVIHLRLAPGYQQGQPAGLGTGTMFRIEAVVAILVGLWVLLSGSRPSYVAALGVSASALATVVLYRYVDVPQLGPLPPMYEPVWFTEKTLTAVAEGVAALAAATCLVVTRRRPRSAGTP